MGCLAYLINLPRDVQRCERMHSELATMNIRYERVEAVYGKALSEAERRTWYDETTNQRRYHQSLTPGEIGCYASHQQVAQRLLDSREPYALVLEDDVHLLPELHAVLKAVADLPEQWDMIKLVGRDHEQAIQRWPFPGLNHKTQLIRYRRAPSRTGAYLLSRSGANKLLKQHRPFFRPVDVDIRYWWESGIRLYGVQPYPITRSVDSALSTIGAQATKRDTRRWRKLLNQLFFSIANSAANRRLQQEVDPFSALK